MKQLALPDRPRGAPLARPVAPAPAISGVRAEALAVLGITVLGASLRFATISGQSYWLDEAGTVHLMHLSFGAFLHQVRVSEGTPPLYFILAWLWAKLFGTGEAGLRSLSALAGVGVIPLTYACGRELISRWTGLLAALFAAVSPFLIWYSQEARPYMLLAALAGLSFLFFARAERTGSTRDIVWWALFSALAVSTQFFAAVLVAAEAVWLLVSLRSRTAVAAAAIVAAAQAAWIPLALSEALNPESWMKAFPLAVRIKQVPVDFALSSLYQSSLVTAGLWGAAALAVVVALLIVYGHPPRARNAAIAAAIAACVILIPIVLAPLGHDYVVPRYFIVAWLPLSLVLAAACTAPRTLPAGAALATLVIGAFIWAGIRIDQDPRYQRPDWRGVAAALGRPSGTRAIVAYDREFASRPLAVYLPGVAWAPAPEHRVALDEVDVVGSPWQTNPARLPTGVSLYSTRIVGTFRVQRFRLARPWRLAPQQVASRAGELLGPALTGASVLIQSSTPPSSPS